MRKLNKYLFWYSMPLTIIAIGPILIIIGLYIAYKKNVPTNEATDSMKPFMVKVGTHIANHCWFIAIVQTILIYQIWLK